MRKNYSYKLIISYIGTFYSGWQRQKVEYNTIQGEIEKSLSKILKHEEFSFFGASRTDAGVHASGQVAILILEKPIICEELLFKINQDLPGDISILELEECSNDFNPQLNISSKEYHYNFSTQIVPAQMSMFVLQVEEAIDIKEMNSACKILEGEYNFSNFSVPGIRNKESIRKIFSARIVEIAHPFSDEKVYQFVIEGSGFLKYMIRNIFSLLLGVGAGKSSLDQFQNFLITSEDIGVKKAPAKGLHLFRINYSGK